MGARLQQVLPWQFFLAFALVFGLALCAIVPPYGASDEPQQLRRIWSLAEGHLIDKKFTDAETGKDTNGQWVPRSLQYWAKNFRQRPAGVSELFGDPGPDSVFVFNPQYAIYAPVPYAAQTIGVWLGRAMGMNILGCFYLARLLAFLLFAALTTCAIAQLQNKTAAWIFTTVALLPMTLYQGASISADSTTLALSFLVAAYLINKTPLFVETTKKYTKALIAFVLLALCKTGYVVLGLFGFLYFKNLSVKQRWQVAGFLLAGIFSAWLWVQFATLQYVPQNAAVDVHTQVSHAVAGNPLGFLDKVLYIISHAFLKGQNGFYQIIGILGWLDIPLPGWVYLLYVAIFPMLALTYQEGEDNTPLLNIWQRVLIIAALAGGTMIIFFWLYVSYNAVGNVKIEGLQGRYFLPFLAPFLIAVSWPLKKFAYKVQTLAALLLIVWIMTIVTLLPQCTPLKDRYVCPQYPVSFWGNH